jgi:hypothetical protein
MIPSVSQSILNTATVFKMLVPASEAYRLFEKFLQVRNKANDLLCYTALARLELQARKDSQFELEEEVKVRLKEWIGLTKSSNIISVPEALLTPVKSKMAESNRYLSAWFGPIKEALVKSLDALYREYTMGKAF